MDKTTVFQENRAQETAEYFCRVIGDRHDQDEDTQQIMSSLEAMAWTLDHVHEPDEVSRRLRIECAAKACYLLDKAGAASVAATESSQ